MNARTHRLLLVCLPAFELGCPVDAEDGSLEIMGSYVDEFDGTHEITAETWTMSQVGVFHIAEFDNAATFLVAQNDAGNEFDSEKWSRMDWTYDGQDLYFCQPAYNKDTQEEAMADESADRGDLQAGCSGFPWSQLIPQ